MITQYLNALKDEGNYTYEGISKLSGIPEATVKNVMSGKTADPRFETISKLVIAMGGNLDDIIAPHKEKSAENNAVMAMKHIYDERMAEAKEAANARVELLQRNIATLKSDRKVLIIAFFIVCSVFILFLLADIFVAENGWIRR